MEQDKPEVEDQQECEWLANEVESRLREYLDKAAKEYPPGLSGRLLSGSPLSGCWPSPRRACTATPVSLVKLSIYLMESLADVFQCVASLEDENARLREQLHRRAEELRLAQAAAETLKSTASGGDSSAGVVGRHRFDEAVDVEDEDEVEEEVAEEAEAVRGAAAVAAAACGSSGGAVCRQCGRGGGDAESAAAATKAAVQIAALKGRPRRLGGRHGREGAPECRAGGPAGGLPETAGASGGASGGAGTDKCCSYGVSMDSTEGAKEDSTRCQGVTIGQHRPAKCDHCEPTGCQGCDHGQHRQVQGGVTMDQHRCQVMCTMGRHRCQGVPRWVDRGAMDIGNTQGVIMGSTGPRLTMGTQHRAKS
uniref:Uncharacterized protein n=1 Tax=Macrostomum lignano TaxID=282301 RepID=A0A1I8FN44_9PLAT